MGFEAAAWELLPPGRSALQRSPAGSLLPGFGTERRTRKLLLHRKEIRRLIGAVEREGLTLVPLELYFKKGVAKVALALGKGKKLHDKRETERQRDADREMARALRTR